ncbi:MAG: methyltransferase [Archangium sp.]|nr:methyltransferase [Archangium sp.]
MKLWLLPPDAPSWHAPDPSKLGMPYWAFAWPGGVALARYVLDHPEVVRGKHVLDFGSGCAIEAIAAARAGAKFVLCSDIDPQALKAGERNAAQNGVTLRATTTDLMGVELHGVDVLLVGDVCYDEAIAQRLIPWLRAQAARGITVLVGDPLRVSGALEGAEVLATHDCPFDGDPRGTTLWPTQVLRIA